MREKKHKFGIGSPGHSGWNGSIGLFNLTFKTELLY